MCYAKMYQSSDSDSLTRTFTSPIDISDAHSQCWSASTDHMNDKWYRLDVGDNTWVLLANDTGYSGKDTIVIGPNSYILLSQISMGGTTINSFRVTDSCIEPANPNLPPVYVKFWQGDNFTGQTQSFDEAVNYESTGSLLWNGTTDHMDGDITCLETGPETCLCVYTEDSYGGRPLKVGPSQKLQLRGVVVNGANMDNAIHSFQLYSNKADVDTSTITNYYLGYFGGQGIYVDGAKTRQFYAQNNQYRVYEPSYEFTKSKNGQTDVVKFRLKAEHIDPAAMNDFATVTFSMDYDGNFVDTIQIVYDLSHGDILPQWFIDMMDNIVIPGTEVVASFVGNQLAKCLTDSATEILTEGDGTGELPELNEADKTAVDKVVNTVGNACTFVVDHINTVTEAINKMVDNGGLMYFTSIVAQTIPRAVNAYYQMLKVEAPVLPAVNFNATAFAESLTGNQNWLNDRDNPYVQFQSNTHTYLCYMPDQTVAYNNYGTLVTVKVTARDSGQDNYLDLQAVFDNNGALLVVKGTADLYHNNKDTPPTTYILIMKDGYVYQCIDSDDDNEIPAQTIYVDLLTAFKGIMYDAMTDVDDSQKFMVDASVDVLNALSAAYARSN
jgi:hypothetical protein